MKSKMNEFLAVSKVACWSLVICEKKISPFSEDNDCYSLYIVNYKEGRKQTKNEY